MILILQILLSAMFDTDCSIKNDKCQIRTFDKHGHAFDV